MSKTTADMKSLTILDALKSAGSDSQSSRQDKHTSDVNFILKPNSIEVYQSPAGKPVKFKVSKDLASSRLTLSPPTITNHYNINVTKIGPGPMLSSSYYSEPHKDIYKDMYKESTVSTVSTVKSSESLSQLTTARPIESLKQKTKSVTNGLSDWTVPAQGVKNAATKLPSANSTEQETSDSLLEEAFELSIQLAGNEGPLIQLNGQHKQPLILSKKETSVVSHTNSKKPIQLSKAPLKSASSPPDFSLNAETAEERLEKALQSSLEETHTDLIISAIPRKKKNMQPSG